MPIDANEIRERERFAKDEMCKDIKRGHERAGKQVSGEAIEREVREVQERVYKQKSHTIYKDR